MDSEPYGYTGEWWEGYINLLHLRARWYDVETGTFLSRDPFEGLLNLLTPINGYNYANQNPVNFKDPTGLLSGDPNDYAKAIEACQKSPACQQKVAEGGVVVGVVALSGGTIAVIVAVPVGLLTISTLWCMATVCFPPPLVPPMPIPTPQIPPATATPAPPQAQTQPQPNPNAEPVPVPLPQPAPEAQNYPQPPPTCPDESEPKEIHISLGFDTSYNGQPLLAPFTRRLNEAYKYVYPANTWVGNVIPGNMSVKGSALASAFNVAAQTAKHIHFNLEGIKSVRGINKSNAYNDFAQNFGSKGDIVKTVQWLEVGNDPPPFITADELYLVKRNPTLCQKTTFYKRGSLTLTDIVGNAQICGQ